MERRIFGNQTRVYSPDKGAGHGTPQNNAGVYDVKAITNIDTGAVMTSITTDNNTLFHFAQDGTFFGTLDKSKSSGTNGGDKVPA